MHADMIFANFAFRILTTTCMNVGRLVSVTATKLAFGSLCLTVLIFTLKFTFGLVFFCVLLFSNFLVWFSKVD